jgi:hypothetical protein
MGAVGRDGRVEPGYSDIDLVVIGEFPSADAEIAVMGELVKWQERVAVFGGLFYNLDCLDARDVPLARHLGGAWEMRFDREGLCLAGEPLWAELAKRPNSAARRQQFGYALRRWLNTGARLLDPDLAVTEAVLWDARRLSIDVAKLWARLDVEHQSAKLRDLAPRGSALDRLSELGVSGCGASEIHAVLLPATLEMLEAFAREVTADFRSELRLTPGPRAFEPHSALPALARALLAPPLESLVLLHRAPVSGGYLPVAIASEGAPAPELVQCFVAGLGRARAATHEIRDWCRRPVPLSRALWSAVALFEPAPFAAIAATEPLWQSGRAAPVPKMPDGAIVRELADSSVVQSFALCRGTELRPNNDGRARRQAMRERYAVLRALDRFFEHGAFDAGLASADPPELAALSTRIQTLHALGERHRARLAPRLAFSAAGR